MYYIYHIPGVKIGCTKNPKNRIKQQTKGLYEILETHKDINVASIRELELQKQYGYVIDNCDYIKSVKGFTIDKVKKAGKASASKSWKENRDRELEKCKMGGAVSREKQSKTTIMCDINGNELMVFKNRKEAAKYINGFAAPLTNVLNHPTRTYKGYKWISP